MDNTISSVKRLQEKIEKYKYLSIYCNETDNVKLNYTKAKEYIEKANECFDIIFNEMR